MGLKINACKSCFCAMDTEYLGYILCQDGIKPQPKKVQAILILTLPQNVKQLRRFLGMVQYYIAIWERCSEMLAPPSGLVGECEHTKVSRANKTKRSHGIGILSIGKHFTLQRPLLFVMLPWPILTILRDLRYTQTAPSYSWELW